MRRKKRAFSQKSKYKGRGMNLMLEGLKISF